MWRALKHLPPGVSPTLRRLYHAREEVADFSRLVPLEEIASNDFILNRGLYLQSDLAEQPLHVEQSREQIRLLEKRGRSLARRMDRLLNEIQLSGVSRDDVS
jgi:type I restriction-modification system DNA methylase subunit